LGPYTLVSNRCIDCYYGGEGHGPSCGDAYFLSLDVGGEQPVNPKTQNYAKDLIGQGLTILSEEKVDSKTEKNARTLIERGLKALVTENGKIQTDLNIGQKSDLLISRFLSDQDNIVIPRNDNKNNAAILQDKTSTNSTNDTSALVGSVEGNSGNSLSSRIQGTLNPNLKFSESKIQGTVNPDLRANAGGIFTADPGSVTVGPDTTTDPIPYKCDYINPRTGAKECKSIGVIDSAVLARDLDKACRDALTCTDATKDNPGGCTCTAK